MKGINAEGVVARQRVGFRSEDLNRARCYRRAEQWKCIPSKSGFARRCKNERATLITTNRDRARASLSTAAASFFLDYPNQAVDEETK